MLKEKKDRLNKRKIAYVYLMHRMFEGSPALLKKIMDLPNVSIEDLQDWDRDYKEAVYQTIQEEDSRGVELKDPDKDVPSIKSIKEKILRRTEEVINETTDPSRLASAYKVLSEFEVADDKKDKSVLDAINEIGRAESQRSRSKTRKLNNYTHHGSRQLHIPGHQPRRQRLRGNSSLRGADQPAPHRGRSRPR